MLSHTAAPFTHTAAPFTLPDWLREAEEFLLQPWDACVLLLHEREAELVSAQQRIHTLQTTLAELRWAQQVDTRRSDGAGDRAAAPPRSGGAKRARRTRARAPTLPVPDLASPAATNPRGAPKLPTGSPDWNLSTPKPFNSLPLGIQLRQLVFVRTQSPPTTLTDNSQQHNTHKRTRRTHTTPSNVPLLVHANTPPALIQPRPSQSLTPSTAPPNLHSDLAHAPHIPPVHANTPPALIQPRPSQSLTPSTAPPNLHSYLAHAPHIPPVHANLAPALIMPRPSQSLTPSTAPPNLHSDLAHAPHIPPVHANLPPALIQPRPSQSLTPSTAPPNRHSDLAHVPHIPPLRPPPRSPAVSPTATATVTLPTAAAAPHAPPAAWPMRSADPAVRSRRRPTHAG